MKKFLFRTACFLLLQVGVGLLLLSPDRTELKSGYLAALRDKIELVKTTPGPRVLFLGGSNVAFGVDSGYFESALGRPAINLGSHAGLGLDFYLRIAEQHAQSGDVIVLLPEYNLLKGSEPEEQHVRSLLRQYPGSARYLNLNVKELFDDVALSEFAYWTQLGISQRISATRREELVQELTDHQFRANMVMKRLAKELLAYREQYGAQGKTPLPMKNLQALAQINPHQGGREVYQRSKFDGRGDMIGHHHLKTKLTANQIHPVGFPSREKLAQVIERLKTFDRNCRRKGASVYLSYSPLPRPALKDSLVSLAHIHNELTSSLDIPIVNLPETLVFPPHEFYDSVAHLTLVGKKKRSRILLEGLVRHLPAGLAPQQASRKQKARQ